MFTHCRSGYASFAANAPAKLKPSVETLPQPRCPRGICDSYTVLVWSRVLPESAVTNDDLGSSTFIRSPITRYGLIGLSFDSISGRNFAMNAFLPALISSRRLGFLD